MSCCAVKQFYLTKKKKKFKNANQMLQKVGCARARKRKLFFLAKSVPFCTTAPMFFISIGPRTFLFSTHTHLSITLNEVSQIIHRTSKLDNNYNTTSTNLTSIFNTPDVFIVTIRSLLRESLYQLP